MKLHRDLGITQKSAWHLAHRIRESWEEEFPPTFPGPVEIDEVYIGGRESNRHANKKRGIKGGPRGKTPVVGIKDRNLNQISAQVVQDTTKFELLEVVRSRTAEGTKVYTDQNPSYSGLPNRESVRHNIGEYVRNQAHTNEIESFWSLLKRGYYGTYHQMSPQHVFRYVNEFQGRHNVRPLDTIDQMKSIVSGMEGKRLRYKDLTR